VEYLERLLPNSRPLQLPDLRHLELCEGSGTMPMSFLTCCTQLQVLRLSYINLSGPGSLVASSMLQRLELQNCKVSAASEAADPVSWQQVFPGPGRLPHLTSLKMTDLGPRLQHADMECVVACCSNLQVLQLDTLGDRIASAVTRLSGLTSLTVWSARDQQCISLAQLTGLRELRVDDARLMSAAGLRQLTALEQLTGLGLDCFGRPPDVLREHMSDRLPGPLEYLCVLVNKVCV